VPLTKKVNKAESPISQKHWFSPLCLKNDLTMSLRNFAVSAERRIFSILMLIYVAEYSKLKECL
jgi:hypothetical protein